MYGENTKYHGNPYIQGTTVPCDRSTFIFREAVLARVRDDDRRGKAWLCKAVFPTKLGLGSSQGTAMATSRYKQVSACAIFNFTARIRDILWRTARSN